MSQTAKGGRGKASRTAPGTGSHELTRAAGKAKRGGGHSASNMVDRHFADMLSRTPGIGHVDVRFPRLDDPPKPAVFD